VAESQPFVDVEPCPWCGLDPVAAKGDRERIEQLNREVRLLRETVARLRATGAAGAARVPTAA
jgi:hypothetical protein